jgi:hypothetical protein
MSTQQSSTSAGEKPSYPAFWDFDQDGPLLAAPFVRFSQGQTKLYGPKPVCVVEVDGEERSLWLTQTVLFQNFRRELQGRPDHTLVVGERISAEKHEPKMGENGREYIDFTVVFHDSPAVTTDTLFGLETGPTAKQEEPQPASDVDDDVPF